ncbi:hypothetical protein EVAR_9782_1 [Eumeta japonica]|uniref:ATP-dependent DNA helicase n=1 Tax=Eumeta variegata TaxID=151549 RepID=A0A4C1U653_EUMVA|nr:hypothetical protein EVAR_9782_1 [Eumeta japonica]
MKIDDVISAELPNTIEDPILFETVRKHMVHGPCGELNLNSPCMKDGKCTKRYPCELIHETQTGGDAYPLYKRRKPDEGGYITTLKMSNAVVDIDNRWIVPYSPLLSKMFDAHINVEYKTLRDFQGNDQPMGGALILLAGDFPSNFAGYPAFNARR